MDNLLCGVVVWVNLAQYELCVSKNQETEIGSILSVNYLINICDLCKMLSYLIDFYVSRFFYVLSVNCAG